MTTPVYTAIYGPGYDRPKAVGEGTYVLYTDQPDLEAPGWEVRHVPMDVSPMLAAKYWKTHPHQAVGGEASIWIDGSMTPVEPFVARCERALEGIDYALMPHPWRDCVYDELEASVGLPKYVAKDMHEQVDYYRAMGHPAHWGLFASGFMVRRHTPEVLQFGEAWWWENLGWSWQDQLSLAFLIRTAPLSMKWKANLPWATWWGYTDHGVW